MIPQRLVFWMVVVGLGAGMARADWLQFRGTQAAGESIINGAPVEVQKTAWRVDLPGRGLSSPVVVGERVFITACSGPGQKRLHLLCLRAQDGRRLWERQFLATGSTVCQETTCVAAPSPASDGKRVFVLYSSGDAACFDLDGNLQWVRAFGLDYPNARNSIGMSSSPVFAGGVFVAQLETDAESLAIGLDPETGIHRWKMERPKKANWTSPLVVTRDGATLVFLQSSAGIHAVDPASGRLAWSYSEGASTIPSSAYADGVLYVPSHGITALKTSGDSVPRQLWRSAPLRPAMGSPLVVKDRLYLVNDAGVLTCADVADGRRVWQLRLKGPVTASPLAAGTMLYAIGEDGTVQVVDTTKPEGEVVAKVELGDRILGTPSLDSGALYLRSDQHAWRLGKP